MTPAPTPTPTNPENAETNALNHPKSRPLTDCTATSIGRSKKNGAGWRATSTVSTAKRRAATMATAMKRRSMSPVSRCSQEACAGVRRPSDGAVASRAITKYYTVAIMLDTMRQSAVSTGAVESALRGRRPGRPRDPRRRARAVSSPVAWTARPDLARALRRRSRSWSSAGVTRSGFDLPVERADPARPMGPAHVLDDADQRDRRSDPGSLRRRGGRRALSLGSKGRLADGARRDRQRHRPDRQGVGRASATRPPTW